METATVSKMEIVQQEGLSLSLSRNSMRVYHPSILILIPSVLFFICSLMGIYIYLRLKSAQNSCLCHFFFVPLQPQRF